VSALTIPGEIRASVDPPPDLLYEDTDTARFDRCMMRLEVLGEKTRQADEDISHHSGSFLVRCVTRVREHWTKGAE
jgi:hypothetical protein